MCNLVTLSVWAYDNITDRFVSYCLASWNAVLLATVRRQSSVITAALHATYFYSTVLTTQTWFYRVTPTIISPRY